MAALTEGRNTPEMEGVILYPPVAAGVVIFEGSLVAIDADGNAQPAEKTEGLIVLGRAEDYVDNTKGQDGDQRINVKRGCFLWDTVTGANAVTAAHLYGDCYIEDDQTVTADATGSSRAGKVIAVYADGIAVETR